MFIRIIANLISKYYRVASRSAIEIKNVPRLAICRVRAPDTC